MTRKILTVSKWIDLNVQNLAFQNIATFFEGLVQVCAVITSTPMGISQSSFFFIG